jgi:hypothetical protein
MQIYFITYSNYLNRSPWYDSGRRWDLQYEMTTLKLEGKPARIRNVCLPIISPECNHYISPLGVGWIKSRLANSSSRRQFINTCSNAYKPSRKYVLPSFCDTLQSQMSNSPSECCKDDFLSSRRKCRHLKSKRKREFSLLNPLLVFHCNHNLNTITLAIFILQKSTLLNPCCYQINFNAFFQKSVPIQKYNSKATPFVAKGRKQLEREGERLYWHDYLCYCCQSYDPDDLARLLSTATSTSSYPQIQHTIVLQLPRRHETRAYRL